jgi:chromosome segregation ATPase
MPEAEEEQKSLPSGINFDEYESELQKMEYEEAHKAEKIQGLKASITKLEDYKKKFKAKGRDDMVKKIDKDISATKKELDALEK